MKQSIFLSAIMFVLAFTIHAQNDTMYIMKNGNVAGKYNVNTEVDSVIFYQPQTQAANTFTDSRDGTVYRTVSIDNQVWMAENLKYLPGVSGPGTGSETTPYYYVYDYDGTNLADAKASANYTTYGVLYNWPAAMNGQASSASNPSGLQGVCPTGWHLPSDAEWTDLTASLGEDAGGKLKETGTTHWKSPNTGATNETGFTALPGGYRGNGGSFDSIGDYSAWWSATEDPTGYAWSRSVNYYYSDVFGGYDGKELGFSVRCVRD